MREKLTNKIKGIIVYVEVKLSTGLKAVYAGSFSNCDSLTEIKISNGPRAIKYSAFVDCDNLKEIIIKSKKINKIEKQAFNKINKNVVFKVPISKKQDYKKLLTKRTGYKKSMKIK